MLPQNNNNFRKFLPLSIFILLTGIFAFLVLAENDPANNSHESRPDAKRKESYPDSMKVSTPLSDGQIFFTLGDVSGKGMNAALLMATTVSLLHCLGKTTDSLPKMMAQVNNEICESARRGSFIGFKMAAQLCAHGRRHVGFNGFSFSA